MVKPCLSQEKVKRVVWDLLGVERKTRAGGDLKQARSLRGRSGLELAAQGRGVSAKL